MRSRRCERCERCDEENVVLSIRSLMTFLCLPCFRVHAEEGGAMENVGYYFQAIIYLQIGVCVNDTKDIQEWLQEFGLAPIAFSR